MATALDFLEPYKHDGEEMLSRIVTGDETWVHHFTPALKRSTWFEKNPKNHRQKNSKLFCQQRK